MNMSKKLPQGWKEYRLGDIGKIYTGNTPPTRNEEFYNSPDVMFVKPDDFIEEKINIITTSKAHLSNLGAEKGRFIPKGSLLVTCIGILGKVGIIEKDCCFNQQINAIVPNIQIVIPEYIAYYILKNRHILEAIAGGAVVPMINKTQFSNIKIYLPPLEKQERIVSILERAEGAICKREESNRLLDEYLKSVFVEMFGDPVTNPKGWDKIKLKDAGTLERGKSKHRPRNAPELLGGIYPLIQTGDIANSGMYLSEYTQTYSEIGLKQSKMWNKGTLAITIAANIAKTAVLDIDACFPDSVVGFIPNEYTNVEFVCVWMSFLQDMLEKTAPESAQKNINLKILGDLDIIAPPIELQEKFTQIVYTIEVMKKKQINSNDELNNLFNSLMQRAFSGEL